VSREEIKHIVTHYFRKLKKLYKSIDPNFDVDAIHDFRVSYKKLRAFFRLVSAETNDELKVPRKLKKVYKALGVIRDMQLQRQKFKGTVKPKQPQAYLTKLSREIKRQKEELLERFSDDIITESKKKIVASLPSKLGNSSSRDFIRKKQSGNQVIITSGDFSDDNLHSIRKNLKDIYYIQEISLENENKRISTQKKKIKEKGPAKEFLDSMGDFQDKRTGISLIRNSWLMQFAKNEQALLIQIKQGWMKDKANMKRTLVRKLKSLNHQTSKFGD